MARLIEVELRVRDLAASLRFYRDLLGLACEPEEHDGVRHAHATWGSWGPAGDFLMLNLYPAEAEEPTRARLGLIVDDLAGTHARLVEARVVVRQAPRAQPWGRSASYLDPDGNVVSLTERPGR